MNSIPAETSESSEEESDSDSSNDEESAVLEDVTSVESVLATHAIACLDQKFTRLPCAAHKVILYKYLLLNT